MEHPVFKDYIIHSDGKIYSKYSDKFLKQRKNKGGYLHVVLYLNNTRHFCLVHRLVAEMYCKNSFNYPQVNHINGITNDNNSSNLEWVTHEMNNQSINKINQNFGCVFMYLKNDVIVWRHSLKLNKKQYDKHFETEAEAKMYRLFLNYCFYKKENKRRANLN